MFELLLEGPDALDMIAHRKAARIHFKCRMLRDTSNQKVLSPSRWTGGFQSHSQARYRRVSKISPVLGNCRVFVEGSLRLRYDYGGHRIADHVHHPSAQRHEPLDAKQKREPFHRQRSDRGQR
jgi:hypothetical protein